MPFVLKAVSRFDGPIFTIDDGTSTTLSAAPPARKSSLPGHARAPLGLAEIHAATHPAKLTGREPRDAAVPADAEDGV